MVVCLKVRLIQKASRITFTQNLSSESLSYIRRFLYAFLTNIEGPMTKPPGELSFMLSS